MAFWRQRVMVIAMASAPKWRRRAAAVATSAIRREARSCRRGSATAAEAIGSRRGSGGGVTFQCGI